MTVLTTFTSGTSGPDAMDTLNAYLFGQGPLYMGQSATNCRPPRNLMSAGAGRWQRTASPHFARNILPAGVAKAAFPNWRQGTGTAEVTTGAGTIRAWLEYPVGTFTATPETAGGAVSHPVGNTWLTYPVTVPDGAYHRWIVILQNDLGTPFFQFQAPDNVPPGCGWESSTTSIPTTPNGVAANVLFYGPVAIWAPTRRPSWIEMGDSRAEGGTEGLPDSFGESGLLRPSLGPVFGCTNLSQSATSLFDFLSTASKTYRNEMIAGCSHIICPYGVNDLGGAGRTAAQLAADFTTLAGLYPNQKVFATTLPPYLSTSDGFQTIANQTNVITGNNQKVTDFNTLVRAGIPGIAGYFDIARAFDPYRTGRYPVTANPLAQYEIAYPNTGVVFTGSVAANGVMTVTAVTSGTIKPGDPITGSLSSSPNSPQPGSRVMPYGTNSTTGVGGTGTYQLTRAVDATSSKTLYVGGLVTTDGLHWSDVGRALIVNSGAVNPAQLMR